MFNHLPIKAIASGKNCDKFCERWSLMGIFMYLNVESFSNLFGTFGVTFKMYVIPWSFSTFRSAEFLAFPRNRYGITFTGTFDVGESRSSFSESQVPYAESSAILRLHNPSISFSALFSSWPSQNSGKFSSKFLKPPETIQDFIWSISSEFNVVKVTIHLVS